MKISKTPPAPSSHLTLTAARRTKQIGVPIRPSVARQQLQAEKRGEEALGIGDGEGVRGGWGGWRGGFPTLVLKHIQDVKKEENRRTHVNLYIARYPRRYCNVKHQFEKIN